MRVTSALTAALLAGLTMMTAACGSQATSGTGAAGSPAAGQSGGTSGGSAPAGSQVSLPAAPRCSGMAAGAGLGGQLTIHNGDNGRVFCVPAGIRVVVFLSGSAAHKWTPIKSSSAALVPVPDGAMMLRIGVTGGAFSAVSAGTATLTSTRSACAACTPVMFRVTLVISLAA